jgi:alginate O-acetyltransferase complex protein AlgI
LFSSLFFYGGGQPGLMLAWSGVLAYTFQLYFDFSGYSDMAIGVFRMFGVNLPLNFSSPYKARNISEFWRPWHMTLSQFLRDYLYIPLGAIAMERGGAIQSDDHDAARRALAWRQLDVCVVGRHA